MEENEILKLGDCAALCTFVHYRDFTYYIFIVTFHLIHYIKPKTRGKAVENAINQALSAEATSEAAFSRFVSSAQQPSSPFSADARSQNV